MLRVREPGFPLWLHTLRLFPQFTAVRHSLATPSASDDGPPDLRT